MSYLEKRQNPLSDTATEEIETALSRIEHFFGNPWLSNENGTNPLQKLWNRRDALSTNELFTFGKSLIAAEHASEDWLKGQVKLVRGKDENNQKGAVFEILAVGYASAKQSVTPAPANQPGYDVDIETPSGAIYRTSLKRYSQSSHERLFQKKSALAEAKFLDGLNVSRLNASMYIEAREYLGESDWQKLYQAVYRMGVSFTGAKIVEEINKKWLVGLLPLIPEQKEQYSKRHTSYSFICASAYHQNEQNNFLSKLESAVYNLERHVKPSHAQTPIIIMLLPVTASASSLKSWAQDYLNANSSSAVDAVFFIQPYTATNQDSSSSHIAYFLSAALSKSFHSNSKQSLELEVPVGVVTNNSPKWFLNSNIGQRELNGQYVYQQGKHYILASSNGSGGMSANIIRKAPGIETFAVMNLNGESFVLGGRWGEELCLIGG